MPFTLAYECGDVRDGPLRSIYLSHATPAQNAAIVAGDTPPTQLGDVWIHSVGFNVTTVATFHAQVTAESAGVEFGIADPAGAISLYIGTLKWRPFNGTWIGTEPMQLQQPILWRRNFLLYTVTPPIDANAAPTAVCTTWAVVRPTRRTS